ncbi:hypothetical protein [Georgenia sp. SUBG003]|uniref:hypothetical protein n=1 Tax=Georgenia sp. SUBG003 TaxID=1497974 RepID=UPI003AB65955
MATRSKNYRKAAERIHDGEIYAPLQAVRLAKETATTKFDSTVEVVFRLGVDPRKADQMVRGTVNLPHGTGKTARVLVFAVGDRACGRNRVALIDSKLWKPALYELDPWRKILGNKQTHAGYHTSLGTAIERVRALIPAAEVRGWIVVHPNAPSTVGVVNSCTFMQVTGRRGAVDHGELDHRVGDALAVDLALRPDGRPGVDHLRVPGVDERVRALALVLPARTSSSR